MQPPDEKPLPLPTLQEAEDLRQVAMMIHQVERQRVVQTEATVGDVEETVVASLNSAL